MTARDLLLVAGMVFPGVYFLVLGIGRLFPPGGGQPVSDRISRLHVTARDRLVETGIFPFPGVRLVTSCRPLHAAEAAFLGILAPALIADCSIRRLLLLLPLSGTVGFLVLFLSMREQARQRIRALRSSLPIASFLLSLLLEAGTGSHVALQEVSMALPRGPLADELKEISRARMLGIPRKEALDRSRHRVPLDDYHTFLNLIQQGEELGVGLSRALRDHSGKLLEKQQQRAEALAQKAAIRILLPLVLFIFPAVFLVILSPVLLNLWAMWAR